MMLKNRRVFKGQFEKNLPGLTVPTKMQTICTKLKLKQVEIMQCHMRDGVQIIWIQCHSLKCIRQVMRKTKYITQTQRMMI